MPIQRVYTTVYYVDDWDTAVAFYRDTLGLKPLHVEQGWAEFEVGTGGRIALH
ncbi:MAG: VOC family protein, partial [Deltaproteobacteria bacterium]